MMSPHKVAYWCVNGWQTRGTHEIPHTQLELNHYQLHKSGLEGDGSIVGVVEGTLPI